MKILIACEFSGTVRDAFIRRGHDAISCDLLPTEKPGPHLQDNVLNILDLNWEMMIAFPPCTHLARSGARWFKEKKKSGEQKQAIDFFMSLVNAPIGKIAIENPVGIMNTQYRKPDQIIHPYYFGDPHTKQTCLWLKNLVPLQHFKTDELFGRQTHVERGEFYEWINNKGKKKKMAKWFAEINPGAERGKKRSVMFPGIASAMAEQWGNNE